MGRADKIMLPHILSAIVAGTISFIAYNYITNMWLKIMLGGCLYTLLYVGIAYVIDKSSFMTIYNSLKNNKCNYEYKSNSSISSSIPPNSRE